MLFDSSDHIEVSYETFRSGNCNAEKKNKGSGPITRSEDDLDKKTYQEIIEISNEAEGEAFYKDLFCNIFSSNRITEDMVQMLDQCTLRNLSEDDLINLIVLVISRFQECRQDGNIDLFHWISCLNDTRALLVVLSNKYIVNEYMRIYQAPVWRHVKCYLKYFLGLIKLDASAACVIIKYEKEIVHLFNSLAWFFQVKQIEEDLRLEFKHYIVQLFLTSTSAQINESIMHVICTAINKYEWMNIYLEEIFNYDRHDGTLRLRYNFKIKNKKYNVKNTTMLLIRLIENEIDKGIHKDFGKALKEIYPKCDSILRVCLNSNSDVLTSLMEDFNKMSSDPNQIPEAGMVVLYYFILLRMTRKITEDNFDAIKYGNVIDVCFGIMTQVCENFKLTESKCKHLKISSNVVYELLNNIDKATDQFSLMSVMFSFTILSEKNTLTDEDKAIIQHSMLTFTDSKNVSKKKIRRGKQTDKDNEILKVVTQSKHDQIECVLKKGQEYNIALCFNYFINERLKQNVVTNCLQAVLYKIKKTLSNPRVLKYLQNLRKFYVSSYRLIDEISIDRTILILYETINKNSEHKTVQGAALSLLCDICCKQENHYQKNKLKLCKLLDETNSVVAMEALCNFFLKRFEQESRPHSQIESTNPLVEPHQERFDTQYTVIHSLLRRMKNPNFKSVILNFFSKIWFCEETILSKLETKVDQMIKLLQKNWRDELEQLIHTFFDPASGDLKKSMLRAAKQIVNSVIQMKKDDEFAWEIVLYFSNVNITIVKSYIPEFERMVKDMVAEKDAIRLGLVVKIMSNILLNNKKYIDQKEFEDFVSYLGKAAESKSSLDIQLMCIELLSFFKINKKMLQEKVSQMYFIYKEGTDKIDEFKSNAENKMTDILLRLSAWVSGFPQIVKCDKLKQIHIALIKDIHKIYFSTDKKLNKILLIRALGKIHRAFNSTFNKDDVFKLYCAILKDSTDDLKYYVVNNINTHIKQCMKTIHRTEKDKEIKPNLKIIDNELLQEPTEIANLYLSPVLNAYYTIGKPEFRAEIAKFLMINLRFGTLVAPQVIEHLIAMLTDSNFRTVENVLEIVKATHQLNHTLLINNFKGGINKSYNLRKMIGFYQTRHQIKDAEGNIVQSPSETMEYKYKILGYKEENKNVISTLNPLFDIVQKQCNIFLKMLVKYVEETIKQITNYDKFAYLVENITTFQYTTTSQLRTVMSEVKEIVTDQCNDCISQYDQYQTETQVCVIYLRMVQVNYLIQMNTFFNEKYDFPQDLIYNPRYETSKIKLKIKERFDEEKELRALENARNLFRIKYNHIDRIKSMLPHLRAVIIQELSKILECDGSSQDIDLIGKNTDDAKQTVDHLGNFDWKFNKISPGGSKCDNKKTKKMNDSIKNRTKSDKDNSPIAPLQEKIKEISKENKIKACETNVNEDSIDQNNNNDQKVKIVLTVKRPLHSSIIQKAKEANMEWDLAGDIKTVFDNKKHIKKSSRKVHFEQPNLNQILHEPSNEYKMEEKNGQISKHQILVKTKEVQEQINDDKTLLGSTEEKKFKRKSDKKDNVNPKLVKPKNENEIKKVIANEKMVVESTKQNKKKNIEEKTGEQNLAGLLTKKISKQATGWDVNPKQVKPRNENEIKKVIENEKMAVQSTKQNKNRNIDEKTGEQNLAGLLTKKISKQATGWDVNPKQVKSRNENEMKKVVDNEKLVVRSTKENKNILEKIGEENLVGLLTKKISKQATGWDENPKQVKSRNENEMKKVIENEKLVVRSTKENKNIEENTDEQNLVGSLTKKISKQPTRDNIENETYNNVDRTIDAVLKTFTAVEKPKSFENHPTDDDDDFMLPVKKRRKRLSDHLDAVDNSFKDKQTKKKKTN